MAWSIQTSQTEMAETIAWPWKVFAEAARGSPALIQIQAWVSRTAARRDSSSSTPRFAERRNDIAEDFGVFCSAAEEGWSRNIIKWNHLSGGLAVTGDDHAAFFLRDGFDDAEAGCFKASHGHLHKMTMVAIKKKFCVEVR